MKKSIVLFSIYINVIFLLSSCGDSLFLEDQVRKLPGDLKSIEGNLEFLGSDVMVDVLWRQGPVVLEESKLLVILKSNKNLEDFTIEAKIWMPSMNHGSYPIKVTKLAAGVFELSDIFFTMKGDWDLELKLLHKTLFIEETKWSLDL